MYPALHKLEHQEWIEAEWAPSENNRRAKYYKLTSAGRKALKAETAQWERLSSAISLIVNLCEEPRKEECRDARGLRLVDAVRSDVRYSVRQLRKYPVLTAASVLTIAVGIGPNAAMATIISSVFTPLPVSDPDRLAVLAATDCDGWDVDVCWVSSRPQSVADESC